MRLPRPHVHLLAMGLTLCVFMLALVRLCPGMSALAWGVLAGVVAQTWLGWWLLAPMPLGHKRAMVRRLAWGQSGKWVMVIALLTPIMRTTPSPMQSLLGFVVGFALVWACVLWMSRAQKKD